MRKLCEFLETIKYNIQFNRPQTCLTWPSSWAANNSMLHLLQPSPHSHNGQWFQWQWPVPAGRGPRLRTNGQSADLQPLLAPGLAFILSETAAKYCQGLNVGHTVQLVHHEQEVVCNTPRQCHNSLTVKSCQNHNSLTQSHPVSIITVSHSQKLSVS